MEICVSVCVCDFVCMCDFVYVFACVYRIYVSMLLTTGRRAPTTWKNAVLRHL